MTTAVKTIDIDNRSGHEITEELMLAIKNAIDAVMTELSEENEAYEISVSIVDKDEIKNLNATYRNTDSVTDVLSFPMQEHDPDGVLLLGDVVICYERACEQAEEYSHSLLREISYLTVHSALHLFGYDHMDEEDKLAMRAEEKKIMRKLGIFKEGSFND